MCALISPAGVSRRSHRSSWLGRRILFKLCAAGCDAVARCMGVTACGSVPSCWAAPASVVIGLRTTAKRAERRYVGRMLGFMGPPPGSRGRHVLVRWPLVIEAQRADSPFLSGGLDASSRLRTHATARGPRAWATKIGSRLVASQLQGLTRQSGSSSHPPPRPHCPTLQYHALGSVSCCFGLSSLVGSPACRILQARPAPIV
jgi:hypothetical protein